MKHTLVAVDIAKSVFEIAVSKQPGAVAERHRLSRTAFVRFFAQRQPATVLLEACGSAHHWGRTLQEQGHQVVLLPPHLVRPYVARNKTDRADAKALLEAFRNKDLHPVPVKSVAQQTLASLHRLRSRWMSTRTARINGVRGFLREFGMTIPAGSRNVLPRTWGLLEDPESGVPEALRPALVQACEEIQQLEKRIQSVERQLSSLATQIPVISQLRTIPGVGLLTATAIVAFVGDIQRFPSGRRFASYLGLTPRERSSGLVRRLGGISKRGESYLRMLLIHGARSVLWRTKSASEKDRLQAWALRVESARGHNKAAVALANKMARIVWAVWRNGVDYQQQAQAA